MGPSTARNLQQLGTPRTGPRRPRVQRYRTDKIAAKANTIDAVRALLLG
ncbi:MAG: hypothetical protein ACRDSR_04835 [Pseudonocardiaceae bacterium]